MAQDSEQQMTETKTLNLIVNRMPVISPSAIDKLSSKNLDILRQQSTLLSKKSDDELRDLLKQRHDRFSSGLKAHAENKVSITNKGALKQSVANSIKKHSSSTSLATDTVPDHLKGLLYYKKGFSKSRRSHSGVK